MQHGKVKTAVVIAVGLLLGYVIAGQLNAFLGISFMPKDLPQEAVYTPGPPAQPAAPLSPVAAIVLPDGARQDELYLRAATELAGQLEARSGQRPAIVDSLAAAPAGRQIVVGAANAPDEAAALRFESPEAFAFVPFAGEVGERALAVIGGGRSGDVYGNDRIVILGFLEFIDFGQASGAIKPANWLDLQAEVASYEPVLQLPGPGPYSGTRFRSD